MPEIRPNRTKRKLQRGQPATVVSATDADAIEMLGATGAVDGVLLSMEHGPVTWESLGHFSRTCDLWEMTPVVEAIGEPWHLGHALDRGAQGVFAPHINSKTDALRAVRGSKYTPIGMRGIGGPRQGIGVPDYLSKANDEILLVVKIEEVEAVNNLEEILTVDQIDCFFPAASDLSQSMGYLGQPNHADVQEVIERCLKQITAAGRIGGAVINEANVERFMGAGALFLLTSVQPYITNGLRGFQEKVASLART